MSTQDRHRSSEGLILRSQNPLYRRALRAAAGAALFGGQLACGGSAPTGSLEAPGTISQAPDASVASFQDPGSVTADRAPLDGVRLAPVDGGMGPDAGVCDPADIDWAACCEAIGWDPERGCAAWGPPAPPMSPAVVQTAARVHGTAEEGAQA